VSSIPTRDEVLPRSDSDENTAARWWGRNRRLLIQPTNGPASANEPFRCGHGGPLEPPRDVFDGNLDATSPIRLLNLNVPIRNESCRTSTRSLGSRPSTWFSAGDVHPVRHERHVGGTRRAELVLVAMSLALTLLPILGWTGLVACATSFSITLPSELARALGIAYAVAAVIGVGCGPLEQSIL
jgi:hypothetical protein